MKRKTLVGAFALLAAANVVLATNRLSAVQSPPFPWGTCVCVDGSDPENPQPPYDAQCWDVFPGDCGSDEECSC